RAQQPLRVLVTLAGWSRLIGGRRHGRPSHYGLLIAKLCLSFTFRSLCRLSAVCSGGKDVIMSATAGLQAVADLLDDAPRSRFHRRAVVISGMGFFTDAYDLFVISTV